MESVVNKKYQNAGNEDVMQFLLQPGRVLDIGCGAGDNARILNPLGFKVDVVSVLGAGDAFAAGFIYGFLQGWDWLMLKTILA